ncbi:MAG: hypothetical protein J7K36_06270 [Archaeoglobaceae archaeon]|nr:hypothetical protein [Archaeoglobaceae archaeon]
MKYFAIVIAICICILPTAFGDVKTNVGTMSNNTEFDIISANLHGKVFASNQDMGIYVMAGDSNFRRLTFNDWEPTSYIPEPQIPVYEPKIVLPEPVIIEPEPTSYIPEPQILPTGTYLIKKMSSGYGKLTIENGLQSDAVVVLSNFYNPKIALIAVYIQAGDTYTITGIEDGVYTLYFVIGKDWDNNKKEFRQPEMYSRFKDSLVFETTTTSTYIEYTIYTVTLHPVVGGQAETERVSKDEFPKIG